MSQKLGEKDTIAHKTGGGGCGNLLKTRQNVVKLWTMNYELARNTYTKPFTRRIAS